MTEEIFHKSISIAKDYNQFITIGGGEPTLHPQFKNFLLYAVWELVNIGDDGGYPGVHLVTNGSDTETSLTLAKLAKQGVLAATVSRDRFHDPVDPRVYRAFEKEKRNDGWGDYIPSNNHDYRFVNGDSLYLSPHGRAKKLGEPMNDVNKCACDTLFVTPKGDIYPCGCKLTKLGNVLGDLSFLNFDHFEGNCELDNR